MTTGEGMVHATASIVALWNTPGLDLTETYFLTTGVAGGNPKVVSTGSVTCQSNTDKFRLPLPVANQAVVARFSVQPSMQYEIDAREKPENFTTGYLPQGSTSPDDDWGYIYDTEVFSVNTDLRDIAASFVDPAQLIDSLDAKAYRANYGVDEEFAAGTQPPSVVKCDVASSDTWFTGPLLANEVERRMKIWTNGSALYCTTAQEDGAVLAALLRGALAGKVDYNRIIVMRTSKLSLQPALKHDARLTCTVSDYDRPYPGQSVLQNLLFADTSSYETSVTNIYIAGSAILKGLLREWSQLFQRGISPSKYTGDIWGTLGGSPDFGPGRVSSGYPVSIPGALSKRYGRRRAVTKRSIS